LLLLHFYVILVVTKLLSHFHKLVVAVIE